MEFYPESPIQFNCSCVLVGKDASATGRVILGHNEDDYHVVAQVYHVPRKKHLPGETVRFGDGDAIIPQVEETYAYHWSEMRSPNTAMPYSDTFVNEWGVAVVSDSCVPCRVPEGRKPEASIGYGLRRLVAERAKTAREGVELAVSLVEQFGYRSARSYEIADKDEAWVLQVVQGRHYAARRVPDGEVLYIPNWYTIHGVDWNDTEHKNWYFSPDLAEYAARNGWYRPAEEGSFADFDFAAAYQEGGDRPVNIVRARGAWRLLLGRVPEDLKLFSAKPPRKIGVEDVKRILRSHYEGTEDDAARRYGCNPHMGEGSRFTICSCITAESCVVAFAETPALTRVLRASPLPCVSPYVPWYLGISAAPEGYAWYDPETAQQTHFHPAGDDFAYRPSRAFWAFQTVRYFTEFDYGGTAGPIRASIRDMERRWDAEAETEEDVWKRLAQASPAAAERYLTDCTAAKARQAWDWANATILRLGEERIARNAAFRPDEGRP